jgi:hypothetical protein
MKINLKNALMISVFCALLNEATYSFISKYEAWIFGGVIAVISALVIASMIIRKKA